MLSQVMQTNRQNTLDQQTASRSEGLTASATETIVEEDGVEESAPLASSENDKKKKKKGKKGGDDGESDRPKTKKSKSLFGKKG